MKAPLVPYLSVFTWVAILFNCPTLAEDAEMKVRTTLTYGIGGSERSPEIICGETVCIALNIDGLTTDAAGTVSLHTQVELLTDDGRLMTIVPSKDASVPLPLGGNSMRHFSLVSIPRDAVAGKYIIRLGVRDNRSRRSVTKDIPIAVLDRSTFGALGLRLSRDVAGLQPAGAVFFTGDTAYIHFSVGGYDVKDQSVRLRTSLRALDENKRPAGLASAKFEPERNGVLPTADEPMSLYFSINLNRAGRFFIRLEVEDLIGDKKVEYDLPIVVTDLDVLNSQRSAGAIKESRNR